MDLLYLFKQLNPNKMNFTESRLAKKQFTKANRFKLIMAGGNGFTRGATYRKYIGKNYLTVEFSRPEYEYEEGPVQPKIIFTYGDHTKILLLPHWTNMSSAELVIAGLQQSLKWCIDIRVNPKSVAQEIINCTCFNEMVGNN
jgi:hypothetical protein